MKIGLITFEVPWTFMGGVEIHTVEIAKSLTNKGHDVHIFTRGYKGKNGVVEKKDGVIYHYIKIPSPKNFTKLKNFDHLYFKRFAKPIFKKNLKKEVSSDFDILHSQNYDGSSIINKNIPMVATIHTSIYQEYLEGKLSLPRGLPQRIFVSIDILNSFLFHSKIRKEIVVSEKVKEELQRRYGTTSVVIPNGTNRPNIIDENKAKEYLELDFDEIVLYFGRIEKVKGPQKILKIFEDGYFKNSNIGVIYGGTGSYLKNLKKKVKKRGLEKKVKFLGFVTEEDKKYVFSCADCFALPSRSEGQPITLVEAISYGLPCYVTDKKWIPKYLRDFGVQGDLITGIKKTLEMKVDKNRVKYWDDIAEDTLNVYRKIIKNI